MRFRIIATLLILAAPATGCVGPVIERVNFPEAGCTGEEAPIMESVGGKVVAICVDKGVAQFAACAKSVAGRN